MLSRRGPRQSDLFLAGSLEDLVPKNHILRKVDRVVDFSWVRGEIQGMYNLGMGRPGIDPEVAVRLWLAGFFLGIVHDRRLMVEAQVNLALRWFVGYGLQERLPDHSSLSRLRARWGAEGFERIFLRVVGLCVDAGLVSGKTVHVDSTFIEAKTNWQTYAREHSRLCLRENPAEAGRGGDPPTSLDTPHQPSAEAPQGQACGAEKEALREEKNGPPPDAQASRAYNRTSARSVFGYKQHTAVDSASGVVLDCHVTTATQSEGEQLPQQVKRIRKAMGKTPEHLTADGAYGHGKNFAMLEDHGIQATIVIQKRKEGPLPAGRFKYDEHHNLVRCPRGRILRPYGKSPRGERFVSRASDCRNCPLAHLCLSPKSTRRQIVIVPGHSALLRAKRRARRQPVQASPQYQRHRWQVEGRHGEAKSLHGLGRALRRGLAQVSIQAYMTAIVMNLKRLAKYLCANPPQNTPPSCATQNPHPTPPNPIPTTPPGLTQFALLVALLCAAVVGNLKSRHA